MTCCRDDNGATALHWAAWLGECEIMKLLLAAAELHKERHTAQLREDVATATAAGGPLPDIKPLTDLESLQVGPRKRGPLERMQQILKAQRAHVSNDLPERP